jgi:hypothetical protein
MQQNPNFRVNFGRNERNINVLHEYHSYPTASVEHRPQLATNPDNFPAGESKSIQCSLKIWSIHSSRLGFTELALNGM